MGSTCALFYAKGGEEGSEECGKYFFPFSTLCIWNYSSTKVDQNG